MFTKLFEAIRGVINKLFKKKDIEDALQLQTFVSDKMREAIELWAQMYANESPWLKEPTYSDPTKIASLGIASFIASEKARMATLEMKSVITDGTETVSDVANLGTRAGYLNYNYKKLLARIRRELEYGIALGGLIIKPYIYKENELEFNYIKADNFYPVSFDSTGKLTEAVFVDRFVAKDVVYTRLEYHRLNDDNTIDIINRAFKCARGNQITSKDVLGTEVPLSSISSWKDIQPAVRIENVDRLLFGYFKMPEANTVDKESPLGVSAFSRAVPLIKEADLQYSRLIWEFEGGQMALDVDRDALRTVKDRDGNFIEAPTMLQQRLFRKIDLNSEETYHVFNPALRDVNYINGLNTIFMRIEDTCGISRGVLSDITRSEAKTATEMIILKQRSFAANADIQSALQKTLDDVIYVMDTLCTLYNLAPEGKYHVSYEWDDSLINSPDEELARRLELQKSGIETKLAIRMWYYGETEEQAQAALDKVQEESRQEAENAAIATGLVQQNQPQTQQQTSGGNE